MAKLNVIDLFAGVGGLSYGFAHNDHFRILFANEYEKDIATAYSLNHPGVNMINDDIRNLTKERILEATKGKPVDVLVGGPPCQSYSTLGKRQMDDRAWLFEEYCRILSIVKPRIFLFENVSGLLSMQGGKLIEVIKKRFKKLGYDVQIKLLNAVDYGVPQHRERVILVGMPGENTFEYPKPTHGEEKGLLPYVTLEEALSDLPVIPSGGSAVKYRTKPKNAYQEYLRANSTALEEFSAPKNGARIRAIMEALPDGGSKEDLPEEIRPTSGYGNTYAKMWWKKPAPTITRNFATPSSSRCIHPRDSRSLTTREGARLQSFPDDYKFYGSRTRKNLEVGNAVPPLLSIALAKQVVKALK